MVSFGSFTFNLNYKFEYSPPTVSQGWKEVHFTVVVLHCRVVCRECPVVMEIYIKQIKKNQGAGGYGDTKSN